jgi:hypothetical protein
MISEYHKHRPIHLHTYIKQRLYEAARPDFLPPELARAALPSYQRHMAYTCQTDVFHFAPAYYHQPALPRVLRRLQKHNNT